MRDSINNEYFTWLISLVCKNRYSNSVSFKRLLSYLHDTEFRYLLELDGNRAEDGIDLRYRFSTESDLEDADLYLDGPCSVLEMMIALSIRCEDTITDDGDIGNRTKQWFWGMITNLGLGSMSDDRFDELYVRDTVERFLNREYEPDGNGGLFTIRNCEYDLRDVEIWYQLCWYLDKFY